MCLEYHQVICFIDYELFLLATVISLDCDEVVCPLVDAIVKCQITNNIVTWIMPAVGSVSEGVPTRESNGYIAMYIGNGISTLTFNATTDRNNTVIECRDPLDGDSGTCTIIITGLLT